MAEAVGLAASVAGLVGLAGQVLQGGLFIQQFFEDIRDAPAKVLDLRDELELFAFVASDTESSSNAPPKRSLRLTPQTSNELSSAATGL